MQTRFHIPLLALAVFVIATACASEDDASSDGDATELVAATAPTETLPTPDDLDAPWAIQVAEAWDALAAANQAAVTEYLEVFDGYTPEEVSAYRDLVSYPDIAAAIAAFPETPTDPDLAVLYEEFTTAMDAELEAGSAAAAQIDANLDQYQSAAEGGDPSDYDEIREVIAQTRDETTQACLDLATRLVERDIGALDCIDGPVDEANSDADHDDATQPAEFVGEELTLVTTSDHDSDEPEGTFTITNGPEALGCVAGTFTDVDLSEDGTELTTELVCETGERAGTIVMVQHFKVAEWWEFVGGDGDFTSLSGGGTIAVEIGESATTVTFTGHATHE